MLCVGIQEDDRSCIVPELFASCTACNKVPIDLGTLGMCNWEFLHHVSFLELENIFALSHQRSMYFSLLRRWEEFSPEYFGQSHQERRSVKKRLRRGNSYRLQVVGDGGTHGARLPTVRLQKKNSYFFLSVLLSL
jgi:hypothetical protein